MLIDIHFHLPADSDEPGCLMSEKLKSSVPVVASEVLLGSFHKRLLDLLFPEQSHPIRLSSEQIRARLLDEIRQSRYIDGAVVLALDGIYSDRGERLLKDSHMVTSNEYVKRVVGEFNQEGHNRKRLYWGASIHPYRHDALDELWQAKDKGAVLIKWIPSAQHIDLSHPKTLAFGKKMAELGLPLLCHCGPEGAIPLGEEAEKWREQEDPRRLEPLLHLGLEVIVAHCAAPYGPRHPDYVPELFKLMQAYSRLYADISALLLGPYRAKSVREFLRSVAPERLFYGSDFPLLTHDLSLGLLERPVDLPLYIQASGSSNLLDKDVLFKRAYGIPETVFQNPSRLLSLA